MKTPPSLLERLRHPEDQAAWAQFVDLYTPLLYYWARRANLADADAADLVQDVFVLLVRKLPEFVYDGRKSFRSWLRKVTLNKWREKQRRRSTVVRTLSEPELDQLVDDAPADEFWDEEYQQLVVARARELMQAQVAGPTWQAFWRVVVDGEPPEQVAAVLGLPVRAVYAAKYRVLVRLRDGLRGLLD